MEIVLKIEIETSSDEVAESVVKSLKTEIQDTTELFERSNLSIKAKKEIVEVEIIANDITSGKASIHSTLQWIENSINILEKYNIKKK